MRVLLFTGKGGVGKTTVAAATAALAAECGHKTLVLSTDPAHSLGDAYQMALTPEPSEVSSGLYALHVDGQLGLQQSWQTIKHYLLSLFVDSSLQDMQAEELTVLPGADELVALLEVRNQAASGRWDVIVVDCAPTAETLRLLALPETLSWYMNRIFPKHRLMMRAIGPMFNRLGAGPVPNDQVFAAVERLHDDLADVQRLLQETDSSVRLVLTPESVVVAEARRTFTSLALYGYTVDSVIANRIFPTGQGDAWRAGWVTAQAAQLDEVRASFAGMPLRLTTYRPTEPVGHDVLLGLAKDMYGSTDPLDANAVKREFLKVHRRDNEYVLDLLLPLAQQDDLQLARSGDELIVTVAGYRRLIALPSVLRRCHVTEATWHGDTLSIGFRPNPQLWPRSNQDNRDSGDASRDNVAEGSLASKEGDRD